MEAVVYVFKERVKIVREHGLDYLIEDLDTGKQYLIDQSYFKKRYQQEGDILPPHTELWERLHQQAEELHQMKKANTNMRKKVRKSRRAFDKKRKEENKVKEPKHFRKGQKRGHHGRNG